MSFLDPYERNARVPLIWRMRLVLLGALLLAAGGVWLLWSWLGG